MIKISASRLDTACLARSFCFSSFFILFLLLNHPPHLVIAIITQQLYAPVVPPPKLPSLPPLSHAFLTRSPRPVTVPGYPIEHTWTDRHTGTQAHEGSESSLLKVCTYQCTLYDARQRLILSLVSRFLPQDLVQGSRKCQAPFPLPRHCVGASAL